MNPNEEKPLELRTPKQHWAFWPLAGKLEVRQLKIKHDGTTATITPGYLILRLTRLELQQRPDLFEALIKTLLIWRKG